MTELPTGWARASIGQLLEGGDFFDGDWVESKDQDRAGTNRLIQLADIGKGRFLDRSDRYMSDQQFDRLRCSELASGDVLVARMPEPLGRACLFPGSSMRCATVVDVAVLRPARGSAIPAWLMHVLNSPYVHDSIEANASGSTRKRISRRNLGAIELPLPPVQEQQRIADKLDTLLTRIDACRDRLDRVGSLLQRFRQAALVAAMNGGLGVADEGFEDPHTWSGAPLGQSGRVSGGLTKNSRRDALANRVPYLRVANVYLDRLSLDDVSEIGATESEVEKTLLESGDLLIVEGNGSLDQVGRVAMWRGELPYCCHQNHLIRWRSQGSLLPEFVLFWLMSPTGREALMQRASSSSGLHTLSISKVSCIEVPCPPLATQRHIVQAVRRLFELAEVLHLRLQAAAEMCNRLTPATLAKAFHGELVPQDPNDEPASALLARLRASGAANAARPGRRRRAADP